MAVTITNFRIRKALICLLSVAASAHSFAQIPPECLEVYIESGAIPVGPNASFGELLVCRATASAAPINLSTFHCTANSGSNWIIEYCGTACPNIGDIRSCFEDELPLPSSDDGMPECPSRPGVGNPIMISTGNKFQEELDYQGTNNLPLEIKRYYNSSLDGWRFNGQGSLTISPSEVLWVRDDGKGITFFEVGNQWQAHDRPNLMLEPQANGQWQLTVNTELAFMFSAEGQLQNVSILSGESLSYGYDNAGRLATVTDDIGQSLTYNYDGEDRITSIIAPDGETYEYSYSGDNLEQVTYSDLTTRTYHYENAQYPSALTGITDAQQVRYATWQYDDQKRATSSVNADGSNRTELTYNDDTDTVTVRNSLGRDTTYHFVELNQGHKLTHVDGHPSANCPASNRSYSYTPDGLVSTQTDWEGRLTRFEYNDRGLEIRRIEAEGTSEERLIETEWHPDFPLRTRVIEPLYEMIYSYDAEGRLINQTTIPRDTQ